MPICADIHIGYWSERWFSSFVKLSILDSFSNLKNESQFIESILQGCANTRIFALQLCEYIIFCFEVSWSTHNLKQNYPISSNLKESFHPEKKSCQFSICFPHRGMSLNIILTQWLPKLNYFSKNKRIVIPFLFKKAGLWTWIMFSEYRMSPALELGQL